MKNVLGTSLLLILSLASIVQAQPGELSARERAYTKALGTALGDVSHIERVGFLWAPSADQPGIANQLATTDGPEEGASRLRVSGLKVSLPGVVVRRFKLEDAGAARLFAGHSELGTEAPVVAELRGDQVIFVHGEPVRDAAFARRALDAAWRGLPVSAPTAEATFANLGDVDLVVATTTHEGPLAEAVLRTFHTASTYAVMPHPGCRAILDGAEDLSLELTQGELRGLSARVHADDSGRAWIFTTRDPLRVASMGRYFTTLTGMSTTRTETETRQRDGLEDVLTRTHSAKPTSDGSIEMAGPGAVAGFPQGDEITAEVSKQVRDEIDAKVREIGELAKQYGAELEATRAGTRVVVDRPLGE